MGSRLTRFLAIAVAAGSLTLFSAPKDAEAVSLNLMNTWQMLDHYTWGNGWGSRTYGNNGPAWSEGAFPRMGVNIGFGIGLGKGDQIVPWIGFAMQRQQYTHDYYIQDNTDPDDENNIIDTGNALQFGLEIGGKFFFIERSKGKAPPFIKLSFVKYFGSIYEEIDGADGDWEDSNLSYSGVDYGDGGAESFDEQMLSSAGFKLAFGAEYYFNDNFCLGGDLIGFEFFWATGQYPDDNDRQTTATSMALYSALTITYRFSFTARVTVEFETEYDYED